MTYAPARSGQGIRLLCFDDGRSFFAPIGRALDGPPRPLLVFMLYLSFLTVGIEALQRELRAMTGTPRRLTLFRLVLLPLRSSARNSPASRMP